MQKKYLILLAFGLIAIMIGTTVLALAQDQAPQSPETPLDMQLGFSYQGRLEDASGPVVSDQCDFQFSLYASESGTDQIGTTQTHSDIGVESGYFSVQNLDFGSGAFQGEARYLAIAVRCPSGTGDYSTLTPRQPIAPAPYALALPGLFTLPGDEAPNLIGGYHENWVSNGVWSATIGGGGVSWGYNRVTDHAGTVGGGANNQAGNEDEDFWNSDGATVSGGWDNTANGSVSAVGGGGGNTASAFGSTVGGGWENSALSDHDTVAGGGGNIANGGSATIGGGGGNTAGGPSSTIAGGGENIVANYNSTVGGGWSNEALASDSTVGGGNGNTIIADAWAATISGGYTNTITTGPGATIGGGGYNQIAGTTANTISGGIGNYVEGDVNTIAGGAGNDALASDNAFIGGGLLNATSGSFSTITGGVTNTIEITGTYASLGGGQGNTISGLGATIPGGVSNTAAGDYSFAAGQNARANHEGSFVWSDSHADTDFESLRDYQFRVRAGGGVEFQDGDGNWIEFLWDDMIYTSSGAYLSSGGTWTNASDANLKENFSQVDPLEILEKLSDIPTQSWNYKAEDSAVRHIGPTAQDFYAAFGLGGTDKAISTVDADGVSLAAIQGLYDITQDQAVTIENLQSENTALEARVAALEEGKNPGTSWETIVPWLFSGALILIFILERLIFRRTVRSVNHTKE